MNNFTYDFSIITPVYNGERFIEETIKSVLECARGFNFEYIIIDDGSTDNTRNVAQKYTKFIKYIYQENSGEAMAVNRGFLEARGTYLLVVNFDDPMLSSELFSASLRIFEEFPEVVVTYPDWQTIDPDGEIVKVVITHEFSLEKLIGKMICLPGPGAVFQRSYALQTSGRNVNLKFLSDYEFWLRMSFFGPFKRIPRVLAQWREHPASTTKSSKGLPMALERIHVIVDFVERYGLKGLLKRQALGHAYYRASLMRYFSQQVPGRRWLIMSIWLRKGWVEELRIHEAIYLLCLPLSENLWRLVQKKFRVTVTDRKFIRKLNNM